LTSSDTDNPAPAPGERRTSVDAFRHRDFTLYWLARVLGGLAIEMQIVAVGWQVYAISGEALDLGLVGLAQFAPFLILFPFSGMAADRLPRKRILAACTTIQTLCAISLFTITVTGNAHFPLIFTILVFLGVARSFQMPSQSAILPNLVPGRHFSNAVVWNSAGYQTARVLGPAAGGFGLVLAGVPGVYGMVVVLVACATVSLVALRAPIRISTAGGMSLGDFLAGFRFIWSRQVILGAISLDLFAVLLGGVTALLPIFAKDILQVDEVGFGMLRAAPSFGAVMCALILANRPVTRRAGAKILSSVGIFGTAIVLFGLSTSFYFSIAMLAILGAADMVSVFVRSNLVQIITPDTMRGRVSAINSVFIGASNELGEFESGITAHWWGTIPAVVVGGAATIAVAVGFALFMRELRGVDSLDHDELVRRYQRPASLGDMPN
jgi:MFS family permease